MTSAPPTPNSNNRSNNVYGSAPDASTTGYDPNFSRSTVRRKPSSPIST